jgi:tetratricopeptide (TPR) repeat protein
MGAGLVVELEALTGRYPGDERLWGQLMTALYRAGRQTDALAVFRRARATLVEASGVEPSPGLTGIHQQILAHDPDLLAGRPAGSGGAHSTGPAQLPADVPGFTGREAELAMLDAALAGAGGPPTAVVISAVSGTAGVGKTALAVHWAHRVADRFPDGQLYVNLRGFDPAGQALDPAQAVRGFLDALGVAAARIPSGVDAQAALYRSVLAGRRMLVVLDNAKDAEQVRPLLPGTGAAVAVVTSRNSLTGLVAADGARPITLDLLSTVEARELLARRLGPGRVAAEPQAVEQIIGTCARLPLALAVAAARAQQSAFPLGTLAAELTDAGRLLDSLDAGDPATQVQAVFSWSYTALTPPAARLFRLLGLHPGPDFSAPAVASLAGLPLPGTRRLLAELTRASLLTEHAPGRYACHDLLRAYATDLTRSTDTPAGCRDATTRLLDHYAHTAHAADQLLLPRRDPIPLALEPPAAGATPERLADAQQAIAWLDAEHPVLLGALHHGAGIGLDTRAWQLAWALDTFLARRGHPHDRAAAWQAALPAAERLGDLAALADAHRYLANCHTRLGCHSDAHAHLQHALDLHVRGGDLVGQARTHNDLAYLWERQDRPDRALDHAQQAFTFYQAAGHHRGQGVALNAVGWYRALVDDYPAALTLCARALALLQQVGDRDGQASAWDSLGYAQHRLTRYAQAADCYQHALDLRRDLGDRHYEAATLARLGDTRRAAGDVDAARTAWQDALNIFTDLDHADAASLRVKLDTLDGPAHAGRRRRHLTLRTGGFDQTLDGCR